MAYNSFNVNSNNSTCNTFDEANNLRSSSPSMQFDYNQELQRNNKKLNDELVRTIYEKNAADDYIRQLEQEKEMRNQKENKIDYKEMLEGSVKLLKAINNVSGKGNDNTKNLDYYIKHKNEFINDIEDNIKWVNDVGRISRNNNVQNEMERKYNDVYRGNENKKEFLGMRGNDGNVNDGGYIYNERVGGRGGMIGDNYERNRLEERNDNRTVIEDILDFDSLFLNPNKKVNQSNRVAGLSANNYSDKDNIYINKLSDLMTGIQNKLGPEEYAIFSQYITGMKLSDIIDEEGNVISEGEECVFTYKIKPLPPEFAPESTQFTNANKVTVYTPESTAETTDRYRLYYTVDGTDPITSRTRIMANDESDSAIIEINKTRRH